MNFLCLDNHKLKNLNKYKVKLFKVMISLSCDDNEDISLLNLMNNIVIYYYISIMIYLYLALIYGYYVDNEKFNTKIFVKNEKVYGFYKKNSS